MSKAVNAIIVGLTVFILLTGSIWYVTVARGPSKVSAVEVEQGWESINETTGVIWAQVTFRNPYDFRIDLISFTYEFWVNERRWAFNNTTGEVRLSPRGEVTLPARVVLNNSDVDDWFDEHIANGERTEVLFTGNATFRVGGGELSVPFERRQGWQTHLRRTLEELRNCPQDEPSPCISDAAVKWVLEESSSTLQLVLTVRNNNLDEMTITNRSATLALGGVSIATANESDSIRIARQDGRFFEFPLVVERAKIIDWWIHHVQACERSDATLDVVLDYEVKAQTFPPEPTLPTTTPTTTLPTATPTTTTPAPPTTTTTPPTTTPTTTSTPPPDPVAPVANLTVNDTSGYAPLEVSFAISDDSGAAQANATWTLDFGDGQNISGAGLPGSANHQYASPGTFQAVLAVTSDAGASTDSQTITVEPTPAPTTTSTDPTPTANDTNVSEPAPEPEPANSSSSEPTQSWFVGLRKSFEYPLYASALELGILEPPQVASGRPTTNGVERIAWDLELGEFRTGFACSVES